MEACPAQEGHGGIGISSSGEPLALHVVPNISVCCATWGKKARQSRVDKCRSPCHSPWQRVTKQLRRMGER